MLFQSNGLIDPLESLETRMLRRLNEDLQEETQEEQAWEQFMDPDPVRWIRNNFYIPETHGPLILHPSQEIPLYEALSKDENGLFKYSTVVWGSVKKSAKSTIAAAVCSWFMWQKPWSSGKIIGNDLKQADSRVAFYMRRAIQLHPVWRDVCKVINYKITFPNHSIVEAIPIDPEGEAGGNDDFVSYTELWAWRNKAALKLWTESTLSPTKYGQSMRWADTYAGEEGEAPVLEQLYTAGVKNGELIDPYYEMYRNGRLFMLWNTRHHLPYQTKEYLEQEATTLTPSEYERVHENKWSASGESFVPGEWWDACQADIPPLDPDETCIVIADASVSGDCFGVMVVSGLNGSDNPGESAVVRYTRKWTPPKGQKLRFLAGDKDGPEDEIRRLINTYNVIEFCYDPFQLEDMASRLNSDLIVHVYAFSQNSERLIADKGLHDMIRDRKIYHPGDPDLTEHVKNANSKKEGEKLRIIKRAEHLKIDLCVCLSMGAARVSYHRL